MADQHLFSKTLKTTKPADSERLAGGSGSSSDYNFTWAKLREWIGDIASFIFTGSLQVDGSLTAGSATIDGNVGITNGNLTLNTTQSYIKTYFHLYQGTSGADYPHIGYNAKPTGTARTFNRVVNDKYSLLKFAVGGFQFYGTASNGTGDYTPTSIATLSTTTADFKNLSLTAGNITSTGTAIDFTQSGTVLTVGVGADNGTVSAGIFTDRTKHYEGDALKEIKEIKGLDGEIIHSTLPSFAQAKVKKTNVILGEKISVEAVDAFDIIDDETVLKDGVKINEGTTEYYTQTETKEETEDDERDLGAMISVLTSGIQQLITQNEELLNRIESLEDNI